MRIKTIVDEDFVNFKEPVMYIGTSFCDGKCCREAGIPLSVCQNYGWRASAPVNMADDDIIKRYLSNDITKAMCFAGLEPFEQFDEMKNLISKLRNDYHCNDTIVIYTGYDEEEIKEYILSLKPYGNIVVKFGRFIPGQGKHYDDVLGIYLASYNQYGKIIC